jgi:hypothetical protein
MPLVAQPAKVIIPEQFGVVDIIPPNQSGETNQNSEPSLGVGVGTNYGEMVVHAFTPPNYSNYYYTSPDSGGPPWSNSGQVMDGDATLDWSTAGTCYLATLFQGSLKVRQSSNPASVPFTTIAAATYTAPPNGSYPEQPWVRVVNVTNADHIFVGFNDLTRAGFYGGPGNTASVRYSLDGGTIWRNAVIEKTIPGAAWDAAQVRLAISADGTSVYAMFQRATSWTGSSFGSDFVGDVVVVRDDGYGGSGYGALGGGNGTLVAHNILISWFGGGETVGAQVLGANSDLAINPTQPKQLYAAYTEAVGGMPVIRVQSSTNSGAAFSLVYSITNASLPALAVTTDGIVGLLYAMREGKNVEVHFLKAFTSNFASGSISNRTLTRWSNNNPIRAGNPYIGDYFTLKAVGYDFFGAFSASGEPQPSHFPSGVFYQRNVKVSGTVTNNFTLSSPGTLVDLSHNSVAPSIDPFAFYDIAPGFIYLPVVEIVFPFFYNPIDPYFDPSDPYSGVTHVLWPVLPANQPPFQLVTSLSLASVANWALVPANLIAQANGASGAIIDGTQPQQFYRLRRDLTGGAI